MSVVADGRPASLPPNRNRTKLFGPKLQLLLRMTCDTPSGVFTTAFPLGFQGMLAQFQEPVYRARHPTALVLKRTNVPRLAKRS